MDRPRILLIIPAYNEEDNIMEVYKCCQKKKEILDAIVINDGSQDNTLKILRENNIPHVNLIQNVGTVERCVTGYKYAYRNGYDIAVQFDGDGQHNVEYVEKLTAFLENGQADMVIGSRFVEKSIQGFKSSRSRRIGIRIISGLIRCCTGCRITDPTSGFRAVNRRVMEKFVKYYPIEYPEPDSIVELLAAGFKVTETAVVMNERTNGQSSIHSWKNIYYMINVCLSIILTSISGRRER